MNAIDKYIAGYPPDVQKILNEIRKTIKSVAPQAIESLSYGVPTFKMGQNLVHFAGYKNHIGFYPGVSGIIAFRKEISGYKWSKGTIQFPLDKPIPYDLIKAITEFRVQEVLQKT